MPFLPIFGSLSEPVIIDLAGNIFARSSLGASVSNSISEGSGTSSGSSINGALSITKNVISTIASRTTVGAASNNNAGLDGSEDISGDSEFDGNSGLSLGLYSYISSISQLLGQLTVTNIKPAFKSLLAFWLGGASKPSAAVINGGYFSFLNLWGGGTGSTIVSNSVSLEGGIVGRSTIGAALNRNAGIDGSTDVSGDSDFDGINGVARGLLGNIFGRSTVGAASTVNSPDATNVSLDSEFDGTSTVIKGLRSELLGQSDVSGNENIFRNVRSGLSGISSLSGSLSIAHAGIIELIGSIFARSTIGASVNRNAGLDGSTDVSGDSDFDGQSNIGRSISGTINSRSTLGSAANLDAYRYTDVSIDSDFDGIISNLRNIVGSISGLSNITGQIGLVKGVISGINSRSSIGSSMNRSILTDSDIIISSDLDDIANIARTIIGQINGRSTWLATLSIETDHDRPLIGSIFGISRLGVIASIHHAEQGQETTHSDLDGVLSVNRRILSHLDNASFLGANISRNLRFFSNNGISNHGDFDANLGLLHNLFSNIRGQSTISGAELRNLRNLFSSIDGRSVWIAGSPLLSQGMAGGIGAGPDLDLGLNIDRQLLAQLLARSLFGGNLTRETINIEGLEVVNFTLKLIKNPSFTISHIKEKEFMLER